MYHLGFTDLSRLRHLSGAILYQMESGLRLSSILESIMHPDVEPPNFPEHILIAPTVKAGRDVGVEGQIGRAHGRPSAAEILRSGSNDSTKVPNSGVRTPQDLEGDLFR
jgi:hypothetical protein